VGSIIERIERALGVPGLAARLVEQLEPSDLQSLLLDVQRRSALARSAPGILAQYAERELDDLDGWRGSRGRRQRIQQDRTRQLDRRRQRCVDRSGTSEAACSLVDARGVPRALDGDGDGERRCDVGAVEVILAACTNGADDDADGATDAADPECQSAPWWDDEARPAPGCGLGWELAVPLLLLRRGTRLGRSRSRYSIRTPVV
jgi:hypothetical protein